MLLCRDRGKGPTFSRTIRIDFNRPAVFRRITRSLVVQHGVPKGRYSKLSRLGQQGGKLFSRAPFGRSCKFLVKFSKIPQIVAIVAVALRAVGFAAWW